MEKDIYVLLLGATKGAYVFASAFCGDYDVPVTVMDENIDVAFEKSAFVSEMRRVPGITYPALLRRALSDFYEAHAGRTLLLLPMTAAYARAVFAEREYYERMFLLPQKTPFAEGDAIQEIEALLLVYRGREGVKMTSYGRVVAVDEEGAPLALIVSKTPDRLLETLPDERGIFLYVVDTAGRCVPYFPNGEISPLCAFSIAQDTSVAEWMLFDYVLCKEPKNKFAEVDSLFSLLPYRTWRRQIKSTERTAVSALRRMRLFATAFNIRREGKSPIARAVLRRFYRGISEKQKNAKK